MSQEQEVCRETLVERHISYANALVRRAMNRFSIPRDLRSDLASAAYLALVESVNSFQPCYGVKFTTYAYLRIQGAIVDEWREVLDSGTWDGAYLRMQKRRLESTQILLNLRAAVQGGELNSLSEIMNFISVGAVALELHEQGSLSNGQKRWEEVTPEDSLNKSQRDGLIKSLVVSLPEQERSVIEMTYFEGLTFEETAKRLVRKRSDMRLSRSWVSRIHAKALARLRVRLINALEPKGDVPEDESLRDVKTSWREMY